jgi:hypothetical protein
MRLVSLLLGAGFVLLPAAHARQEAVFTSKEGSYTARFPGTPKVSTQTARTQLGELKLATATFASTDGSAYLVTYTDFPAGAVTRETEGRVLDGIRDGLKGQDGKVLSEKAIEFGPGKLPGRELLIEKGRQHMRFKVVLKEERLYQAAVIGTERFVKGTDATRFLDSFEIGK